MGTGIAQLTATVGHEVVLFDTDPQALQLSRAKIGKILQRQVEKNRVTPTQTEEILSRLTFTPSWERIKGSQLVVEAIVENLELKQDAFRRLEKLVDQTSLLATNTSSLAVTALASVCRCPQRVIGMHFFNPAPLMPLVEVVPGLLTDRSTTRQALRLAQQWGKTAVVARDTPGFIVNRVARPFYGEALRLLEEGVASAATIDWAMRQGGFPMGPFELMDLIGNDINYTVTEEVFTAFYFDARYRPSLIQKRMVEAGLLGRKSGRGFYDYGSDAESPVVEKDQELARQIFERILFLLINEAFEVVFRQVASVEAVELSMTKGVRYPWGLFAWAEQFGLERVLSGLEQLHQEYLEERYRPNPLLKRLVRKRQSIQEFSNLCNKPI